MTGSDIMDKEQFSYINTGVVEVLKDYKSDNRNWLSLWYSYYLRKRGGIEGALICYFGQREVSFFNFLCCENHPMIIATSLCFRDKWTKVNFRANLQDDEAWWGVWNNGRDFLNAIFTLLKTRQETRTPGLIFEKVWLKLRRMTKICFSSQGLSWNGTRYQTQLWESLFTKGRK